MDLARELLCLRVADGLTGGVVVFRIARRRPIRRQGRGVPTQRVNGPIEIPKPKRITCGSSQPADRPRNTRRPKIRCVIPLLPFYDKTKSLSLSEKSRGELVRLTAANYGLVNNPSQIASAFAFDQDRLCESLLIPSISCRSFLWGLLGLALFHFRRALRPLPPSLGQRAS